MKSNRVVSQEEVLSAGSSGTTESAERVLVIERIFDAPPSLVFKAWTDPKQVAQWWGPKGFTNPVCEMDARPGGAIRIVMRAPDGAEHPIAGVFREVVEPKRLVFTSVAVDAAGNPIIDGLTTVTFAEHGGKTKLTLHRSAVALNGVAVSSPPYNGFFVRLEMANLKAGCLARSGVRSQSDTDKRPMGGAARWLLRNTPAAFALLNSSACVPPWAPFSCRLSCTPGWEAIRHPGTSPS